MDYQEELERANRILLAGMKAGRELERNTQASLVAQLERDCMTMALRLYGESPDTFAPETRECMARWRPRVEALLQVSPAMTTAQQEVAPLDKQL